MNTNGRTENKRWSVNKSVVWNPWKTHWALALVKGIREPHEVKLKFFWPRWESNRRPPDYVEFIFKEVLTYTLIFFTFCNVIWFCDCKSPFVNISCHLQWETLTDSMPFLSTYIDPRTVNFFPPAESWLVNLNFPRASRMEGGPTKLNPIPSILAFPQHLQRKPPKRCADPEERRRKQWKETPQTSRNKKKKPLSKI